MSREHFHDRLPERPSLAGFLDALRYDAHGLVSVVVQDARSGAVLMLAHANRTALEKSLASGVMHYYSRSRMKLWEKGEESGHRQHLENLFVDCDGDALVAQVRQVQGACHLGYRSCFAYRVQRDGKIQVVGRKTFDPKLAYRAKK